MFCIIYFATVTLAFILHSVDGSCHTSEVKIRQSVTGRNISICTLPNGLEILNGSTVVLANCESCSCDEHNLICCFSGSSASTGPTPPKHCKYIRDGCDDIMVLKADETRDCFTGRTILSNGFSKSAAGEQQLNRTRVITASNTDPLPADVYKSTTHNMLADSVMNSPGFLQKMIMDSVPHIQASRNLPEMYNNALHQMQTNAIMENPLSAQNVINSDFLRGKSVPIFSRFPIQRVTRVRNSFQEPEPAPMLLSEPAQNVLIGSFESKSAPIFEPVPAQPAQNVFIRRSFSESQPASFLAPAPAQNVVIKSFAESKPANVFSPALFQDAILRNQFEERKPAAILAPAQKPIYQVPVYKNYVDRQFTHPDAYNPMDNLIFP